MGVCQGIHVPWGHHLYPVVMTPIWRVGDKEWEKGENPSFLRISSYPVSCFLFPWSALYPAQGQAKYHPLSPSPVPFRDFEKAHHSWTAPVQGKCFRKAKSVSLRTSSNGVIKQGIPACWVLLCQAVSFLLERDWGK